MMLEVDGCLRLQVLDGTDLAGTEYWMPHSLDSPYYAASGA
jgi:hypothetical protein